MRYLLIAFYFAATGVLSAQSDRRDIEATELMLMQVREKISTEHFDPKIGGEEFTARFAAAAQQLKSAKSTNAALATVAQVVENLGDSHTFFLPPPRPFTLRYGVRLQPVGKEVYVEGVRPGSDAEKQGVKAGERVVSINGLPATRDTLPRLVYLFYALNPQPGLRLSLESADGTARTVEFAATIERRPRTRDLASGRDLLPAILDNQKRAKEARSLFHEAAPGLLIWKLPAFAERGDLNADLDKARGYAHVVLDLRGNVGGYETTMLDAIGAFFDRKVQVGIIRERDRSEPLETAARLRGAIQAKLYVLVDGRSASAAEIFARTMQIEGRAVVFGDRSSGRVNRSIHHYLSVGSAQSFTPFGVSVSQASVVMRDGKSLENVGVEPDVWLVPSKKDLAAGADPVLAMAIKMAGATVSKEAAGQIFKKSFATMVD